MCHLLFFASELFSFLIVALPFDFTRSPYAGPSFRVQMRRHRSCRSHPSRGDGASGNFANSTRQNRDRWRICSCCGHLQAECNNWSNNRGCSRNSRRRRSFLWEPVFGPSVVGPQRYFPWGYPDFLGVLGGLEWPANQLVQLRAAQVWLVGACEDLLMLIGLLFF